MTAADLLSLYRELESMGTSVWVDGGWGVDALLGEQTRPHKDLDIAIQQKDVAKLCLLLQSLGYREVRLEEARPLEFRVSRSKRSRDRFSRHRHRREG